MILLICGQNNLFLSLLEQLKRLILIFENKTWRNVQRINSQKFLLSKIYCLKIFRAGLNAVAYSAGARRNHI